MGATGYIHGHRPEERARLRRQAGFLAARVHGDDPANAPFARSHTVLEVGAGVGAQMQILLEAFPHLHVTGVDVEAEQLLEARRVLGGIPSAAGRYALVEAEAADLPFTDGSFDGAFLCWILEHVSDPAGALGEVRRVLSSGSPVVVAEVMNATLFLDPECPETMRYWAAYNARQMALGGDPFVGAKLGNLLAAAGFCEITTTCETFLLDDRAPAARAEVLAYWTELLLSGASDLVAAGAVTEANVAAMCAELARVGRGPASVFFYTFVKARAVAP